MNDETQNPESTDEQPATDPDLESTQDLNEATEEHQPEPQSLEEMAAALSLVYPADCLLAAAVDAYRGLGRDERVPEAAPVIQEIVNAMPAIKEGRRRITERKRLLEEREAEEAQKSADREEAAAAFTEARAAAKAEKEQSTTEG